MRPFRGSAGVGAIDIVKRLQDNGFHALTMSWPVSNTPVFEPTESESLEELDRFYGALVEIAAVERGERPREGNVLKMVPHTAKDLMRVDWDRPYSRGETAFPQPWLREKEFWPRVDEVGCW